MNNRLSRLHRMHKGFTLIELVMVIALLAIMAAVVVPTFASIRSSISEETKQQYYNTVCNQAKAMCDAYNTSLSAGDIPRMAGYNISTALAMQEFLNSANNNGERYEIVVVTKEYETSDYAANFNYVDTIVLCIQFYGKDNSDQSVLITRDLSDSVKNVPCSPEAGDKNIAPVRCELVSVHYYQVGDAAPKSWTLPAA